MTEYELPLGSLSEDPPAAAEDSKFEVHPATRVLRLPPYMFGRINQLLYQKRRAGRDVIDLGMGNPSDPPHEMVIRKLSESAHDARNHGYSKSNGILNLRHIFLHSDNPPDLFEVDAAKEALRERLTVETFFSVVDRLCFVCVPDRPYRPRMRTKHRRHRPIHTHKQGFAG